MAQSDQPAAATRLISQSLAIVAVITLSFVVQVALLGGLRHQRDQAESYQEFRKQLALATAPVAPADEAKRPLRSGVPVAILEIPRIGMREVVGEGTSPQTLMSGPGHRRDTPLPGQAGTSVVFGRRAAYGAPFGRLGELAKGDQIQVTTGQGRHSYTVTGLRRTGDPLPPRLAAGAGRLTLLTADGPVFEPTDVLRVDATLTSPAQATPRQLPRDALPAAEQVMAGDRAGLIFVVLWAQLLVGAAVGVVWIRHRTGPWQAWIIGVPVITALGFTVADQVATLLPNLM
jgi:sortase A